MGDPARQPPEALEFLRLPQGLLLLQALGDVGRDTDLHLPLTGGLHTCTCMHPAGLAVLAHDAIGLVEGTRARKTGVERLLESAAVLGVDEVEERGPVGQQAGTRPAPDRFVRGAHVQDPFGRAHPQDVLDAVGQERQPCLRLTSRELGLFALRHVDQDAADAGHFTRFAELDLDDVVEPMDRAGRRDQAVLEFVILAACGRGRAARERAVPVLLVHQRREEHGLVDPALPGVSEQALGASADEGEGRSGDGRFPNDDGQVIEQLEPFVAGSFVHTGRAVERPFVGSGRVIRGEDTRNRGVGEPRDGPGGCPG